MQKVPTIKKRSLALSAVVALALAGCGQGAAQSSEQDALRAMHQRGMTPMRDQSTVVRNAASPAGAHLTYYGGRINANTRVVQVLWGSGSYDSHVSGTGTPSMGSSS